MYRRIFGSIFCCIFLFQLTACGFERLGRMTEFFEIEDAQENEANKLLYYAISEVPNLEAVKEAVERGADVNRLLAYPTKDNVLLYYSGEHMGQDSFNNHPGVDVASYLLENGADPNVVLKNGINLLMYSCDALPISGAGIDSLFDLLLDVGAEVNTTDNQGLSALDYAIQSNNVHKVKRLLACGATYEYETLVRSLSSSSTSPEEISRKCVIAKMMLSDCINNAEFQQSDDIGVLLCMASVRGDEKTIVSQLQRASLNFTDEITYTSSILMAALNSIDVIRSLETSGCVLSEDHLISAISSGNYEVAIYLQQKMISSLSALRLAVQYGQSELTRTFMDFSEKSNNLNSNNYVELDSLLVSAVESGDVNTVQAIIEYGTSYTPDVLYLALQKAIYTDNQDILSFLINEIGCDINYYSTGQMSLLEFAIYHGNYEMFLLLALNDSIILEDSNTYLDAAIIKNNNGVLQHLLEIGIDPNIENPSDNPLIEAIRRGNMDAINLLLEAGADINLKLIYPPTPNEGNEEKFIYPIHEAAKNFSSRILARLIESGADIHLVDSKGRSPLDLAVTSYNYEVIEGEL